MGLELSAYTYVIPQNHRLSVSSIFPSLQTNASNNVSPPTGPRPRPPTTTVTFQLTADPTLPRQVAVLWCPHLSESNSGTTTLKTRRRHHNHTTTLPGPGSLISASGPPRRACWHFLSYIFKVLFWVRWRIYKVIKNYSQHLTRNILGLCQNT